MADATVGDDVYSDDPTVRLLEEPTAALLGKEDAVYMVTGIVTNQVDIRAHTEPGDAAAVMAAIRLNRDEIKNSPVVHARISDSLKLAEMIVAKMKS